MRNCKRSNAPIMYKCNFAKHSRVINIVLGCLGAVGISVLFAEYSIADTQETRLNHSGQAHDTQKKIGSHNTLQHNHSYMYRTSETKKTREAPNTMPRTELSYRLDDRYVDYSATLFGKKQKPSSIMDTLGDILSDRILLKEANPSEHENVVITLVTKPRWAIARDEGISAAKIAHSVSLDEILNSDLKNLSGILKSIKHSYFYKSEFSYGVLFDLKTTKKTTKRICKIIYTPKSHCLNYVIEKALSAGEAEADVIEAWHANLMFPSKPDYFFPAGKLMKTSDKVTACGLWPSVEIDPEIRKSHKSKLTSILAQCFYSKMNILDKQQKEDDKRKNACSRSGQIWMPAALSKNLAARERFKPNCRIAEKN